MSEHQDWNTVVIHGKGVSSSTVPKQTYSQTAVAMRRIEEADGPVKQKTLTPESVRVLQDYRRTATKTQREMDQLCNFAAGTINELEACKRGPTPRELQTLNRLLKTGLTLH
jgi:hypothetical protein